MGKQSNIDGGRNEAYLLRKQGLFNNEVYGFLSRSPSEIEKTRKRDLDRTLKRMLEDKGLIKIIKNSGYDLLSFDNIDSPEYLDHVLYFNRLGRLYFSDYRAGYSKECPFDGSKKLLWEYIIKAPIRLIGGEAKVDFTKKKYEKPTRKIIKKHSGIKNPSAVLPNTLTAKDVLQHLERKLGEIMQERKIKYGLD